ncbi:MAG: hypothetical protein H0W56_00085 [Acidothermales bacterium]|jgi:hypothetical protein|nr:hypothetical protein [Acidothermales bacterium]
MTVTREERLDRASAEQRLKQYRAEEIEVAVQDIKDAELRAQAAAVVGEEFDQKMRRIDLAFD